MSKSTIKKFVKPFKDRVQKAHSYLIMKNIQLLLPSSEYFVFQYVLNRTTGFGGIFFRKSDLFKDQPTYLIPAITNITSKQTAYRALAELEKKNFIVKTGNQSMVVNFPAISDFICSLWLFSGKIAEYTETSILLTNWFKEHNYQIPSKLIIGDNEMSKIKEFMKKGRELYEQEKIKKQERIKKNGNINVQNIQYVMKNICTSYNLKYYEPTWTGKEKKCVKNWLSYCKQREVNPYDQLNQICKYWDFYRQNTLHTDDGRVITLNRVVSFMDYFKYRRQIEKAIYAYKEDWDQQLAYYTPSDSEAETEVMTLDEFGDYALSVNERRF